MITVKYKITKFDKELKLVTVSFDDGGWADIRLVNPLPKTTEELEAIIKQFTAPKEAIEAQLTPDSDLSYIDSLIGIEKECERLSLSPEQEALELDPQVEANMKMWEEVQFQNKVSEALVKLGVLENNPTVIPVSVL